MNIFKLYKLRLDWSDDKMADYKTIAEEELALLEYIKPVVVADPRQGHHAKAHAYIENRGNSDFFSND